MVALIHLRAVRALRLAEASARAEVLSCGEERRTFNLATCGTQNIHLTQPRDHRRVLLLAPFHDWLKLQNAFGRPREGPANFYPRNGA
jgi:hypothetical protein